MFWDKKRGKWTSPLQQRRDERKEQEMIFRKKPKPEVTSAFDNIPAEVQAKLIEDALSIVRTIRQWPTLVPENFHAPIGAEVSTLLRKTGLKMASAFLTDDDVTDSFGDVLKGVQLPIFIRQVWISIKLALESDDTSEVKPDQPVTCEEDPNGSAA